jgi:hypothetical protein
MTNPVSALPNTSFWRRSVSGLGPEDVDPVTEVPFRITRSDRVATAGSCFAQHISRTLVAEGFSYLVTEPKPMTPVAADEGYGVFPARFANLYTVRQLLQLFHRAYGLFEPRDEGWQRHDGRWIDPFRPRVQADGFATAADVALDRESHLGAVRRMFEECDIFVFTLGLTEAWVSTHDGAVFPLAPGVLSTVGEPGDYAFRNSEVSEMTADLITFVDSLRRVNPGVRIILTVSPVPLIATFEPRHVLVSTTYSKAALRVVADAVSRARPNVAYFPSYEIITGPQAGARYYEPDLREVRPEGVAHVMSIFRRHFLADEVADTSPPAVRTAPTPQVADWLKERMLHLEGIICDEEELDKVLPVKGT